MTNEQIKKFLQKAKNYAEKRHLEKCAEILNARGDRRLTDWLLNNAEVRMKLSENDKKMREELGSKLQFK